MNVHPRTLRDGTTVWRLEVFSRGKRSVRTVGPFPGARDKGQKKAEEAWHKLKMELDSQHATFFEPSKRRRNEYLDEWLARKKGDLCPTSYELYTRMIRLHIAPHLGSVQMSKLSPSMAQEWLDTLSQTGLTRTVEVSVWCFGKRCEMPTTSAWFNRT